MKKSEAVQMLDSGLRKCETPELLLEFIVSIMGLKPPSYVGLMRSGEKFIASKHQGADTKVIHNQWEPEND